LVRRPKAKLEEYGELTGSVAIPLPVNTVHRQPTALAVPAVCEPKAINIQVEGAMSPLPTRMVLHIT
jgi:hypothetical protein